jgi:hypothetical protein
VSVEFPAVDSREQATTPLGEVWATVAGLLLLSALGELVSNASVTPAITVLVGLASFYSASGAARRKSRRIGTRAGLGLTALTALLVVIEVLAGLAGDK